MTNHIPRTISLIAVPLYALSLFHPAYVCKGTDMMGYGILVLGWLGVVMLDPRWFANVGFAFLLVMTFKGRLAGHVALFTGLLALGAFLPAAACGAPGGSLDTSKGIALGGILWVAAILMACLANQLLPRDKAELPTQPMELDDR
jgi:hypothetical protein